MSVDKKVLIGKYVTLRAAEQRDVPVIHEILQEEEIHRYMLCHRPETLSDTENILQEYGLKQSTEGFGFVLIWNETGETIGATRLMDVRLHDFQVEIGSTFIAKNFWRSAANTEMKLLFISYCFQQLNCVRVALKCDARNARSHKAILRIGAVQEGILRKNMNVKGYQRDTVYFSILKGEWDNVRKNLLERLHRS